MMYSKLIMSTNGLVVNSQKRDIPSVKIRFKNGYNRKIMEVIFINKKTNKSLFIYVCLSSL